MKKALNHQYVWDRPPISPRDREWFPVALVVATDAYPAWVYGIAGKRRRPNGWMTRAKLSK